MELRDFTREDWFGYSGAERLDDGTGPFIGDRELSPGIYLYVFVTGNEGRGENEGPVSVSAHIFSNADPEGEWWYTDRATSEGGKDTATFLLRYRDPREVLIALGFRRTV